MVGRGVAVDARAAVLGRVADDPAAARTVLSTTAPEDLLPASLGYADGGRALADLVVAGTAPIDPRDGSVVSEPLLSGERHAHPASAANLRRIVGWMATSGPVPVELERSTDRVLRPWIGSVRGGGLGAGTEPHVVLDEGAARRALAAAMDHERTRIALGDAAWTWAAAESARLAAAPVTGAGFDAIGSVVGIVSSEAQDARGRAAVTADVERANLRALWAWVEGVAAKALPPSGQATVATVGDPIRDDLLPATDLELDHPGARGVTASDRPVHRDHDRPDGVDERRGREGHRREEQQPDRGPTGRTTGRRVQQLLPAERGGTVAHAGRERVGEPGHEPAVGVTRLTVPARRPPQHRRDARRAADLLHRHGADPVFAAVVLHGIGASGV
ncbi:MAG: hypothetical protein AAGK32_17375, partial [Actinomycetota bacterium]